MHVPHTAVPLHPYFKKKKHPSPITWKVPAICGAYDWPLNAPGGGAIALVELGGGWVAADIAAYFAGIGQPVPSITDVSVDGTVNSPGSEDDIEVALDIEVAAAAYYCATGRPAAIRIYWAQDIATAVRAATKDASPAGPAGPTVCSISWGADESEWNPGTGAGSLFDMNAACFAATQAGMTVFAAAGDNDSGDGVPGHAANVDGPASCQYAIACGGTSKYAGSEIVWNNNPGATDGSGTGGGYSTVFGQGSSWQLGAPGRMVPDVAANADPECGYEIYCQGAAQVVGGTSAVAPLWAGLVASFGKPLGWIAPRLYATPSAMVQIVRGGNGAYYAVPAINPCAGLGVPIGMKLAALFG